MDDNKIRDAMLDGLQQGIRDAVAFAFSEFCPSSHKPESKSDDDRETLSKTLQRIFVKAQIATQVLIG